MEPFFKPEDFPLSLFSLGHGAILSREAALIANHLLKERMIPVYGKLQESWWRSGENIPAHLHTHQSLILPPWPIEPAKKECEQCKILESFVRKGGNCCWNFCPICGEAVKP
jgi:hypothetical protein